MDALEEKTCRKCGKSKPLGDFYANRQGFDGRSARCKDCEAETLWKARLTALGTEPSPQQVVVWQQRRAERTALPALGKKRCRVCGQVKPLEEFPRSKSHRDGRDSACGACVKEIARQRRAKSEQPLLRKWTEDGVLLAQGKKRCCTCGVVRKLEDFGPNKRTRDGYRGYCRSCEKKHRQNHRMKKNHPPTEQELRRKQAREERAALAAEGRRRCSSCGAVKSLTRDFHASPTSAGGYHTMCKTCRREQQRLRDMPAPGTPAAARRKKIEENRLLVAEGVGRCPRCGEVKPLEEFHMHRYGDKRKPGHCKSCARERHLEYYAPQRKGTVAG